MLILLRVLIIISTVFILFCNNSIAPDYTFDLTAASGKWARVLVKEYQKNNSFESITNGEFDGFSSNDTTWIKKFEISDCTKLLEFIDSIIDTGAYSGYNIIKNYQIIHDSTYTIKTEFILSNDYYFIGDGYSDTSISGYKEILVDSELVNCKIMNYFITEAFLTLDDNGNDTLSLCFYNEEYLYTNFDGESKIKEVKIRINYNIYNERYVRIQDGYFPPDHWSQNQ